MSSSENFLKDALISETLCTPFDVQNGTASFWTFHDSPLHWPPTKLRSGCLATVKGMRSHACSSGSSTPSVFLLS